MRKAYNLLDYLSSKAAGIVQASERASSLHITSDIRASGNEVEIAVRESLSCLLSKKFKIAHGHIIDHNGNVSSQIDIIIADANTTPLVFRALDGTEYIPYECVYAVGEIKTTYDKSKAPIDSFVRVNIELAKELNRENTDPNYIGNGVQLGTALQASDTRPFRNPLFRFMIIVKGSSFDTDDISNLYAVNENQFLPNAVCILDKGVLCMAHLHRDTEGIIHIGSTVTWPEFQHDAFTRWVLIKFGHEGDRGGVSLGALCLLLQSHLNSCILSPLDPNQYLGALLSYEEGATL